MPARADHPSLRPDNWGLDSQCLDQIDLQFEGRVPLTRWEYRVHCTAHGRVEDGAKGSAMDRADRVVEMLPDLRVNTALPGSTSSRRIPISAAIGGGGTSPSTIFRK